MAEFTFIVPGHFNKSIYSCNIPSENYRIKSLLMLLGCGAVKKRTSSKEYSLSTSFLQIPYQPSKKITIKNIVSIFNSYKRNEIDRFFVNSVFKNIKLHKNIYHELLNSLGYLEQKNHISCFLCIYRIVEQIALTLPIVSIIEKASFAGTFTEYKQLIDGKAKSDLSVLKNYSEKILDTSIADSNITFNFARTVNPIQNVKIIKELIPYDKISSETNDTIEIKNKYLHHIIIGFRNQYFHYLFHEKNITHDDLEYPEDFLEVCNLHFLNYYSFLYLDLLKSELNIWS